jgi:hypothetical protein
MPMSSSQESSSSTASESMNFLSVILHTGRCTIC